MRAFLIIFSVIATCLHLSTQACLAQTDEPTTIEVGRYFFSFTVESNSIVTYPENGDGFSCVHNPAGGGSGTQADYGLLAYGTMMHLLSTREAEAAALDPPQETLLEAAELPDNDRWQEIYEAQMKAKGIMAAGQATIQVQGSDPLSIPYFSWAQTSRGKTHYALTYVVIHGEAFIHVQVEANQPFTEQQLDWFTTKLTLLEVESET